jgi:hypothetical protein
MLSLLPLRLACRLHLPYYPRFEETHNLRICSHLQQLVHHRLPATKRRLV